MSTHYMIPIEEFRFSDPDKSMFRIDSSFWKRMGWAPIKAEDMITVRGKTREVQFKFSSLSSLDEYDKLFFRPLDYFEHKKSPNIEYMIIVYMNK